MSKDKEIVARISCAVNSDKEVNVILDGSDSGLAVLATALLLHIATYVEGFEELFFNHIIPEWNELISIYRGEINDTENDT